MVELPPAMPFTDQVTAVLATPVTVTANCRVPVIGTLLVAGVTVTTAVVCATAPGTPSPDRHRESEMKTNRRIRAVMM